MKKLITTLLCTTLLTACGWHLRGSTSVPLVIDSVFVSAEDSHGALVTDLKRTLEASDVALASSTSEGQYRIYLSRESTQRRTASVGGDALAAEYELTMSVDYRIENAAGEAISPVSTAKSFRSYDFDRNAVVAKAEEERLIQQEMRSDLVQQILRRLRFISQQPASEPAAPAAENDGQAAS